MVLRVKVTQKSVARGEVGWIYPTGFSAAASSKLESKNALEDDLNVAWSELQSSNRYRESSSDPPGSSDRYNSFRAF